MAHKTRIVKRTIILNLIAAFVFLCAADAVVMRHRPAATLSILSEYKILNDAVPAQSRVWKIVPELTSDSVETLRFFIEEESGIQAVCTLLLPPPGSVGEIRLLGPGGNIEKISTSGLLLSAGFPAPCDVLPLVDVQDGRRLYQEKREAAGRLFLKNYQISAELFDIEEARSKGWIRDEPLNIKRFVMITATDENGGLAVRQLWPVDESAWWLYEETPQRQSWLLY